MTSSSALLFPLLLALLVQAIIAIGLRAWGSWVGRRHGSPWWRRVAWLPLLALLLSIAAVAISSVYLLRAFEAIQSGDPAGRATALAQNISQAMNASALLSFPAWALYGISVITSLVGTLLRPSRSGSS
jgi:hypothetical protein